ncbi:sorbosone dehydrogenase family protein [Methylobacillus arboreus]|uniref:PQQ-dependent sugar dehydrogenase n=1 Tax=Methylobacillus arboreus TaxID=755170 RepID=UPI001E519057|nr:sorbosone dehydrogenase family protein [Methylobacillus arboreus]MCB5189556.1 sorbosone dehydrogenase family protein [Methylobacillus arboreus]
MHRTLIPALIALSLAACGDVAKLPVSAGIGPKPELPEPRSSLIPTVHVATAVGWPEGATPRAAEGTAVNAFATDLEHPRWLYQLPNGDILVAETNSPPKDDEGFSLRGWFASKFMKRGGAGTPSANRITLLRDTDGDGVADQRSVFLKDLHSPFGMALIGDTFYVANADAVVTFPYKEGETSISAPPTKLVDLPGLPRNHHWTKNLIANADGSKLYVTVGSNSNIGENGLEIEEGRAAIWEVDAQNGEHRIFASGLRNPNGLAWEPDSGALWTAVNERDEIGSDLVPDYITSVQDGGFYGWPYSYYGNHVDVRVQPQKPELVAKAISPDYAVGPHTASLGLAAAKGNTLPEPFANGMFIGQHGSWNRKPSSGYKVLFVPFADGKPEGNPIDVLTGFINERGEAQGRPVGVLVEQKGALLVADDVGNTIWRVSSAASAN